MGSAFFGLKALTRLAKKHEIVCVYTAPPRPSGRGLTVRPSPVGQFALKKNWELRAPKNLEPDACADLHADAVVVAAYGQRLKKPFLERPRWGCLNIHPSLLPRWRGAAPIERALQYGDRQTGVVIMRMEEGLDTGPVLARHTVSLTVSMNFWDVHDILAEAGADLISKILDDPQNFPPKAQTGKPTYAHRIEKKEKHILWNRPCEVVARHINALAPWCVLPTQERLTLSRAVPVMRSTGQKPGTVLSDSLEVACEPGAVKILELQRAGGRRLPADAFLRGHPLSVGSFLG